MDYLTSKKICNAIYYKKPVHLQKVITNNYKKIKLQNTEIASKSVFGFLIPIFLILHDEEFFLKFKHDSFSLYQFMSEILLKNHIR